MIDNQLEWTLEAMAMATLLIERVHGLGHGVFEL